MKLLREPLLHFALAGAALFAAHSLIDRAGYQAETVEPITITDGDVRWMVETWRRQWLREPQPAEVQAMIADLVEEEILAREAIEMGLEQDDTVVRRRLAQKLSFLVEDTSRLVGPTEDELRAFHAAHADRFETGPTVSFTQVFFNPSSRSNPEADARATLAALRGDVTAAANLGDRLLVDGDFRDLDRETIASIFGPEFGDAVFAQAPGSWSGPIASGYGQHLVFVSATTPAKAQPFDDVRDAVTAEWWREKEDAARRDYMALLRKKYPVEIDPAVRALLDGDSAQDLAQK
ncbi:MAG TPA: peptidylprolyl isomerase [Bauldia sp.]|nr:peptidylprolyl isomerase [Bauldia sp.]